MPLGSILLLERINIKSKVLYCKNDSCVCKESLLKDLCVDNISNGICGHSYHKKCINKWLQRVNNCPICCKEWKTY